MTNLVQALNYSKSEMIANLKTYNIDDPKTIHEKINDFTTIINSGNLKDMIKEISNDEKKINSLLLLIATMKLTTYDVYSDFQSLISKTFNYNKIEMNNTNMDMIIEVEQLNQFELDTLHVSYILSMV